MRISRVVTGLICAVAVVAMGAPATASDSKPCSLLEQELGECTVKKTDESVEASGTWKKPGSSNEPRESSSDDAEPDNSTDDATPVVNIQPRPDPFTQCDDDWNLMMRCVDALNRVDPEDDEPAPSIPPITITDLASFAPDPSSLAGEPDNLGVAGLPTNFVTAATTHTQTGELFGYPITVRFTPASFTFHYGDGQTTRTTTGGQSWEALRLPQFSPTDTSHTYTERGTYTARVDVAYTAEIDLGGGWFSITGELTTTGAGQDIRIYEAHTALVAHTCTEDPDGPGC
ncbi:hypothetical protein [Microbacterium sp. YJN-G]|uniref:hypothetical protein n=1 Tax=Microbacterium sp. YJN-G TaxID=2763257 RepID=UPI001D0CBB33|nr:hypothetical protein [Microbacterium sp. YJN-G]